MNLYSTVEDYLEVIAGVKDVVTLKPVNSFFIGTDPIISLARYDVNVIDSMAMSIQASRPLTERQGDLAVKLILKYKRQLAAKNVDIAPIEEKPIWRMPLRTVDYSKTLTIENDMIVAKFPFSDAVIDQLRSFKKESHGSCIWNKDTKRWEVALTEFNLTWLTIWAEQNNFEVRHEVKAYIDAINEVESAGFEIKLVIDDDKLDITNCPSSLREYVETQLGGFAQDNLLRLVDNSAVLGYTLDEGIADAIVANYGPRFYALSSNRDMKVNPESMSTPDSLASILDYADTTQRWPVVIYEPSLGFNMYRDLTALRPESEIARITKASQPVPEDRKYIYTTVPLTHTECRLLISSAGMMFGGDKSLMIQQAEKIVYCAPEVYNKADTKVKSI
jgi:hypothetical protein